MILHVITTEEVLVDVFLTHAFSPHDALSYLLFGTPDFLRQNWISYSQGVWYIMQNISRPQSRLLGGPTRNLPPLLDFNFRTTQGTVVPQRRWSSADEAGIRHNLDGTTLQFPIYFVHRNGRVCFWLTGILQGRDHDPYNRDSEAPLWATTTINICINVSLQTLTLPF